MFGKLPLLFLVLILSTSIANADPITYDLNFMPLLGTTAPTAGSFTYDASGTAQFISVGIVWNGRTISVYQLEISLVPPCLNGQTGAAAEFALLSGQCGPVKYEFGTAASDVGIFEFGVGNQETGQIGMLGQFGFDQQHLPPPADGTFTITARSVPEPNSLLLSSLGIGFVGILVKKRAAAN